MSAELLKRIAFVVSIHSGCRQTRSNDLIGPGGNYDGRRLKARLSTTPIETIPKNKLADPHSTLVNGDEFPNPGGFPKGEGNGFPVHILPID